VVILQRGWSLAWTTDGLMGNGGDRASACLARLLLKNRDVMINKRPQPDRQKKVQPQALPEDEAPAAPHSADIFSTILEFSSAPDEAGPDAQPAEDLAPSETSRGGTSNVLVSSAPAARSRLRRLSPMQRVLLVAIVAVGAAFTYALSGQLQRARHTDALAPRPAPRALPAPPQEDVSPPEQKPPLTAKEPTPVPREDTPRTVVIETGPADTARAISNPASLPGPEPLSLQLADKLYVRRDFEHAWAMYEKLARRLPATEENQPLQDLLLLRRALCQKNNGDAAQADGIFRTVSLSRLPVLRALARYHQSVILLERKRYLEAATKACQTIGLIEVLDYDRKWTSAVQQECRLLVAEAMTRNVLSLCDADKDIPADLWTPHPDIDPFMEMEEPQLRALLTCGVPKLEQAMLSPQIRAAAAGGTVARWSVVCNGAPIEELLARFTTNAKLNLRWTDNEPPGAGRPRAGAEDEDNMRRRPVYLCLRSASAQEVVTTAAGSVGLLARMDGKGTVQVVDPASYASLADHTRLLADETLTLWRRALLADEKKERAANSHFALGLLYTVREQFDQAMAEYRLVANQFPKHRLAPHSLLRSGQLKVRLRDYVGAHEDLKQLVELYPETPLADQAGLFLADATMKAGLYEEATGLYHKVYNLGLSMESQMQAALGAGSCFYETGQFEEAADWLNRYVSLARERNRPEFWTACLMLGKTYLALHKPQQAHAALNLARQGELSRQQHVETVGALAQTCIEQGLLLDALHILEEAGGWQLSQRESVELLLLRTHVLRAIGLTDKAITLLADKSPYLPDPELRGKVAVELGRCYREAGALEQARKTLSEAFTVVDTGPLAQEIGGELADTCLRLGQPAQAIAVCTPLLEHAGATQKEKLLGLLAEAYRRQQKYERAVAVLLDQQTVVTDPNYSPLRTNTVTR
jgi:tetratricopeptide (TPR) repeat protein